MSSDESSDESSAAYDDSNFYSNYANNNHDNNVDDNEEAEDDDDDDDEEEEDEDEDTNDELDQLQKECRAMVTLLKRLRQEEEDLRQKNIMLAREALLCGFQMEGLEAPPPKRRVTKSAPPTTVRKDDKAASWKMFFVFRNFATPKIGLSWAVLLQSTYH